MRAPMMRYEQANATYDNDRCGSYADIGTRRCDSC
jgi:hypothetical protein